MRTGAGQESDTESTDSVSHTAESFFRTGVPHQVSRFGRRRSVLSPHSLSQERQPTLPHELAKLARTRVLRHISLVELPVVFDTVPPTYGTSIRSTFSSPGEISIQS